MFPWGEMRAPCPAPPSTSAALVAARLALAGSAAWLLAGCSFEAATQAGVAVPYGGGAGPHPTRPALALEGVVGAGLGNDDAGAGLELRGRGKLGADITSASLNVGLYGLAGTRNAKGVLVHGSVGAAAFGGAIVRGQGATEAGSPYVIVGVARRVSENQIVGAAAFADYSVRFGAPSSGFVGLLFTYGNAEYTDFHVLAH